MSQQDTKVELEKVAKNLSGQILSGNIPTLDIPMRGRSNTIFDEKKRHLALGSKTFQRKFDDVAETKRLVQTITVAKIMNDLLIQNRHIQDRGIYYSADNRALSDKTYLFNEQSESDKIIEDVEVLTGRFREELCVVGSTKGIVVGPLSVTSSTKTKQFTLNCRNVGSSGARLTGDLRKLEVPECTADFVLVVEKEEIFEPLVYDEFHEKYNCVVATAKGIPDRSTRFLIRLLHDQYKLPVVVLVDSDSYGWYIYSVYKNGSMNLSYESPRLSCPDAMFAGISTSDIEKFSMTGKMLEDIEDTDLKRAQEMLTYSWFASDPYWVKELSLFIKLKKKVKIEALAHEGYNFLGDKYLPMRLKELGILKK